ncbi:NAD(P)-binding protein [bacterium]|jgi:protoporphyrinogen oxidase|nr:NAD(P)-binding protein [bacterium]MBT3795839.1 NAD(P)-binding protein [bacterium]
MNNSYDNIIIGSGITGLTIAKLLSAKNISYLILDKNITMGGKISTISLSEYNLDRGFQILLRDYPTLKLFPEINNIPYKKFKSGFAIKKKDKIFKVLNPLKNFQAIFFNNTFPGFTIKDKYLLIKLFMLSNRYENQNIKVLKFLKDFGFTESFINDFFISFFQGVFLDKKLNVPLRYFFFIFNLFATSQVCIPQYGINQIIQKIAEKLDYRKIKQNVKVEQIYSNYLTTNSGETFYFKKLLCTDPQIEGAIDQKINKGFFKNLEYNSTRCFYFKVKIKDIDDCLIYLFPESKNIANMSFNRLDNDQLILSASSLSINSDKDTIENEILSYFKNMDEINFLKDIKVVNALPSTKDLFNFRDKCFYEYSNQIYFAGDYLSEPSLNGSIQSGTNLVVSLY